MSTPLDYASFLIRLWRERPSTPFKLTGDWHCEVHHIQTGRRWVFGTVDEMLDFLRRQSEDPEVLTKQ